MAEITCGEEARVVPDVITGMLLNSIFYCFLFMLIFFMIFYKELFGQWIVVSCFI